MSETKPSTIRGKQIMVRLNEYECEKLNAFAAKNRVTVSEALRMLIRNS